MNETEFNSICRRLIEKYTKNLDFDFDDCVDMIKVLRAPGGCPWDAEQTHTSIRDNLVEEAYEVLNAIESDDKASMYDELGDVLMQVIYHAEIADENSEFSFKDIASAMCRKMIRRHPHVFGRLITSVTVDPENVTTSEDVLINWDDIKKKEKGLKKSSHELSDVPSTLPALTYAYKIQKKAANAGFDWDTADAVYDKVREELEEVSEAHTKNMDTLTEEVGDLFFAVVNLSRKLHIYPEEALRMSNQKFLRRYIKMENLIEADGLSLDGMSLKEMDAYWDRVKALEKEGNE